MIDYRDFLQQAELDLQRAYSLYASGDFGFSAYSMQQSLEKFLKSYLLKSNLIVEPKDLGHLGYAAIFGLISDQYEQMKNDADFSIMLPFIQAAQNGCNEFQNILKLIENNSEKKIIAWKSSLKIPLLPFEEQILSGLLTKIDLISNLVRTAFIANLPLEELKFAIQDPNNQSTVFAQQVLSLVSYMTSDEFQKNSNTSQVVNAFAEIFKPKLYGTGTNSLSKPLSDLIVKMFTISKSYDWIDAALYAFPHEEIGRYPTIIGNSVSIELYVTYKENLLELINYIASVCSSIKNTINTSAF